MGAESFCPFPDLKIETWATRPSARLDEEKMQRCRAAFDGSGRKLALAKQIRLVLADMVRAKLVRRTVEITRKRLYGMHVRTNSMGGVVTALELIQHPLAKTGHG